MENRRFFLQALTVAILGAASLSTPPNAAAATSVAAFEGCPYAVCVDNCPQNDSLACMAWGCTTNNYNCSDGFGTCTNRKMLFCGTPYQQ